MSHLAPSPSPTVPAKKTGPLEPAKVDRGPVVKQNVLRTLGTPPKMQKFRCVNVFGDSYRITIYCSRENKSLLLGEESFIAHSIFVKVNENGDILMSEPPLVKQYE